MARRIGVVRTATFAGAMAGVIASAAGPAFAATLPALATAPSMGVPPASPGSTAEIIVFSSLRSGNGDLYSVHPDGTDLTRLTSSSALDAFPSISPNGTRVAFVSTRDGNPEIYVMNLDGTNLVRLTNNKAIDGEPEWSPDGTKIVFASTRTGNGDIYSLSATNGAGVTRLTTDNATDVSPAFSPDGSQIAFSSFRSGAGDVYRMQANGSAQTRLTSNAGADLFPAWSPDGQRVAFASLRSGNVDIYTMKPDGTGQARVTTAASVESEPAWSPDGSRLAITSNAAKSLNFDIRLINADGSGGAALAPNSAIDGSPDWAGPSVPALSSLTVSSTPDAAHRASKLVSSRLGGTVETVGADAARYRLFIPPGALAQDTNISIAPTTVSGLAAIARATPYSVEFGPSGLVFSTPATLTITPPPGGPAPGDFIIRWSSGTGVEISLLTTASDGSIVTSVPHFSGETTIQTVAGSYGNMLTLALVSSPLPSTGQLNAHIQSGDGAAAVADLAAIFNAAVAPRLAAVHALPSAAGAEADVVTIGLAADALQGFAGLAQRTEANIPGAGQLPIPNISPSTTLDTFVDAAITAFATDARAFEAHYTQPSCDGAVAELAEWLVVPIIVDSDVSHLTGGNSTAIQYCVSAIVETLAFPTQLPATQQYVDGQLRGGVLAPAQTPGGVPTPGGGPLLFPQPTIYELAATGAVFADGMDSLDTTSGVDGTASFRLDRGSDENQRASRLTVTGSGHVTGFWADVETQIGLDAILPVNLAAASPTTVTVVFRSPPVNDILEPNQTTQLCVDVADGQQIALSGVPVSWSLSGEGSLSGVTSMTNSLGIACIDYHHPTDLVPQGATAEIKAEASRGGATGSDTTTVTPAWISIALAAQPASEPGFSEATNATVKVPGGDQVQLIVTAITSGTTVAEAPQPCAACPLDIAIASGGGQFIDTPQSPTAADLISLDDNGQALVTWDPGSFTGEAQIQFVVGGVAATTTLATAITVIVAPTSIGLNPGQQATFTATVNGTSNHAVTWSATGGTIDQSGGYTAPASGGPFTITATSIADPSATATATVGVLGGGPPPPPTPPPPTPNPSLNVDFLAGTYNIGLICKGVQFGSGTGTVTVTGTYVSMTWSVSGMSPPDADADCVRQAQGDGFPSSGSFSGSAALGDGGTVIINLATWQVSPCSGGSVSPTQATFRSGAVGIPIGTCVSSSLFGQMGYQGIRIGP
jgi:Tol biopolymer transport system component